MSEKSHILIYVFERNVRVEILTNSFAYVMGPFDHFIRVIYPSIRIK